ncbi:MAG: metal-sensitive transcriptional regulator [Dehalococcoidia bacterium]|nr:metal-sensitive transcriptional regulator [Dehalococcoidia bacterium]
MAQNQREQVVARLRSIEGHVRGVARMVEEDAYCIDVIKQTIAIIKAVEKLNAVILDNHLNTCVTTAIRSDNPSDRERVIKELLEIFETSGKM